METRQSESISESFAMIILDFDDTLIPTTIRQRLLQNFNIDIFKLHQDKLKGLQLNIIDSLQNIKQKLTSSRKHFCVEIAVISNACTKWLKQMLVIPSREKHFKSVYFPILSKYLIENNITIHSTKQNVKVSNNKENLWVLKYKCISTLISQKEKALRIPCKQIISFGDGICEKKAINVYSTATGVQSIHFEFIKAPNIYQMSKQWRLIKNNIDILSLTFFVRDKNDLLTKTNCLLFKMNKILKSDNNESCTGTDQIFSIAQYFGFWLKNINEKHNCGSKAKLIGIAEKINLRRSVLNKTKKYNGLKFNPYQKIVKVLCDYKELQDALKGLTFE